MKPAREPEMPPRGERETDAMRKAHALDGIAAELARRRLRGHVYRTEEGTAVFASTAPDDGRTPPENRGPEPVLEAIRKHVGDEPDPWEWIAGLWRPDPIANGVPHPTVYDGPHLLVTGTSAKIASEATAAAADRRLVSGRHGPPPNRIGVHETGVTPARYDPVPPTPHDARHGRPRGSGSGGVSGS